MVSGDSQRCNGGSCRDIPLSITTYYMASCSTKLWKIMGMFNRRVLNYVVYSFLKYMWVKKCVKMYVKLFKNWKVSLNHSAKQPYVSQHYSSLFFSALHLLIKWLERLMARVVVSFKLNYKLNWEYLNFILSYFKF